MVSEWRSVIAVSLNVGGGVRLIKPAKLRMCTQNTTSTTRTDARRRVCAAMVPYSTAEPLGERRYENWNTHTCTESSRTPSPPDHNHPRECEYHFLSHPIIQSVINRICDDDASILYHRSSQISQTLAEIFHTEQGLH